MMRVFWSPRNQEPMSHWQIAIACLLLAIIFFLMLFILSRNWGSPTALKERLEREEESHHSFYTQERL